jgi:protein-L-isoaspartate(D-aspartate) O-methyltransferase
MVYCTSKTVALQGAIVSEYRFETMRQAMVSSQLRTTAVSDPRIVAAMESVPREVFVPAERQALAYVDVAVPLNATRALNAPMVTGRLLNEAQLRAGDHVLVVGSATGYCAAVLARLVKNVVALEEDAGLSAVAATQLATLDNVTPVSGDLTRGWPDRAPYDVIVIDGAVEFVPDVLVDQLTEGGRLVTGIVDHGVTRLAVGAKAGSGFALMPFADAETALLPGFAKAKTFSF